MSFFFFIGGRKWNLRFFEDRRLRRHGLNEQDIGYPPFVWVTGSLSTRRSRGRVKAAKRLWTCGL